MKKKIYIHLLIKVELEVSFDGGKVEAMHDVHVLEEEGGVVVGGGAEQAHRRPQLVPPVGPLSVLASTSLHQTCRPCVTLESNILFWREVLRENTNSRK